MKFLLDIPLVMAFAKWVWGNETKITPTFCVENLFQFNVDCWTRLIAKGLGIAIILGSCLNKTPVIFNLYRAKSTSGISLNSVYGESIMYTNAAFYGMLSGYPVTAYGENLALFMQSFIIINLMWEYATPPISLTKRGIINLILVLYGVFLVTILPKTYYYLLMTSIMPVLVYSRGSQILETYRCQHTGAQSVVTNTVNFLGVSVRIMTTIKEVGYDIAMLGNQAVGCTLNLIILIQFFYYRKNTEQFLADLLPTTKYK
jgi:mannose-P-dolichol utilization defect 1